MKVKLTIAANGEMFIEATPREIVAFINALADKMREPERGRKDWREARVKAGLTQPEVAEMVGVSPNVYTKWENGSKHVPPGRIQPVLDALKRLESAPEGETVKHFGATRTEAVLAAAVAVKETSHG